MKVGVSALLHPSGVKHSLTLHRAISVALDVIEGINAVSIISVDDKATENGGRLAATELINKGVDLVVGPFGSDALIGSLETYEKSNIPLLLPAATVIFDKPFDFTFRICPNDHRFISVLLKRATDRGFQKISVQSDKTDHYAGLANLAISQLGARYIESIETSDAVLYAGRLNASCAWLVEFREKFADKPVLMTDDAADDRVIENLTTPGDLEILGLPLSEQNSGNASIANSYIRRYGENPPIYFFEIIAAFQIAVQLVGTSGSLIHAIQKGTFDTVFGSTNFLHGERQRTRIAIFGPHTNHGLKCKEVIES